MTDMAQIDRIMSEIDTLEEREKIILFRKIEEIWNNQDDQDDEEVAIESAFGLWKDRNITKESLRQKAWKQN